MRPLHRIWEKIRGGGGGAVSPAWQAPLGTGPAVGFKDMVAIYLKDPTARAAIDFLADQAVGIGFFTTAETPRAKDVVDEFCGQIDLDGKLQIGAREIIGYGNSFWEMKPYPKIEKVVILPITSVDKIVRDVAGKPLTVNQTATFGGNKIPAKKIIHFLYNPVNREAFGSGLLRTVAESMVLGDGETREPFYKMKAKMQSAMINTFDKFGAPNELWTFKGLSDKKLDEVTKNLTTMPKSGARWAANVEGNIKLAVAERARSFDAYVDNIMNEYYIGLQTPLPKLFTTPGFTEASARAALELHERRVRGLQRYIKRMVERFIFVPIVKQAGLDPMKAEVRLNWGIPEVPELLVADLLKAFELGAIRTEEFRKMMTRVAGWELWEEVKPEEQPPAPGKPPEGGGEQHV